MDMNLVKASATTYDVDAKVRMVALAGPLLGSLPPPIEGTVKAPCLSSVRR